jgi:hypothetical protein
MARAKAVLETVEAPPRRTAGRTTRSRGRSARRSARPAPLPVHERRFRQTIRRIDLWTVLKMSVCFYLTGLIVTLLAGVVLWWIASTAGVIGNVEDFFGDLLNSDDFRILSLTVLRGATLVGLVVVCLLVVVTTLAAAFYNLFAEILGGVEVTVVEDETSGG